MAVPRPTLSQWQQGSLSYLMFITHLCCEIQPKRSAGVSYKVGSLSPGKCMEMISKQLLSAWTQIHSFLHLKDFFFCQKWKYEVIAINFLINFFHAPKFTVLPFSEYLFWQWKKFQGVNWKRHSEINACRMIQSLEEGNGGELIR